MNKIGKNNNRAAGSVMGWGFVISEHMSMKTVLSLPRKSNFIRRKKEGDRIRVGDLASMFCYLDRKERHYIERAIVVQNIRVNTRRK